MNARRRAPSLLAVLLAHGLLLGGLLQLAPNTGSARPGLPQVAWLSLSLPLPRFTPAVEARPQAAPKPVVAHPPAAPALPMPMPMPSAAAAEAEVPSSTPTPAAAPTPAPAAAPLLVATIPPAPATPEPVITRPDHSHCQPPPYPPPLRERGIEGAVHLRIQVDAQGRAAAVQLQATSGWRLFDEAALAQARACRFQPARRNGVAVDGWVEFPMRFALTTS